MDVFISSKLQDTIKWNFLYLHLKKATKLPNLSNTSILHFPLNRKKVILIQKFPLSSHHHQDVLVFNISNNSIHFLDASLQNKMQIAYSWPSGTGRKEPEDGTT